jgi:hypothetical protein
LSERLSVVFGIQCGREYLLGGLGPLSSSREFGHDAHSGCHVGQGKRTTVRGFGKSVEKLLNVFEGEVLLLGFRNVCNESVPFGLGRWPVGLAKHTLHAIPLPPLRDECSCLFGVILKPFQDRGHPLGWHLLGEALQRFIQERRCGEVLLCETHGRTKEVCRGLGTHAGLLGAGRDGLHEVGVGPGRSALLDEGLHRSLALGASGKDQSE